MNSALTEKYYDMINKILTQVVIRQLFPAERIGRRHFENPLP